MSFLVPMAGLFEFAAEVLADFHQFFVSLKMVKFEAMPYLSVAHGAEKNWSRICIFEAIASIHHTIIINAMEQPKAMAKLMHRNFARPHPQFVIILPLPCEFRQLAVDTRHTSLRHRAC